MSSPSLRALAQSRPCCEAAEEGGAGKLPPLESVATHKVDAQGKAFPKRHFDDLEARLVD
jgi:hypothetical protein